MISQQESERLLYKDGSQRDKPRYTLAQAARYLKIAPATLRSWMRGRESPRASVDRLSFSNLIAFLEEFGERASQLATKRLLAAHLRRVERDEAGLPVRLFPASPMDLEALAEGLESRGASPSEASKIIVIDPRLSFGNPIVISRGIRTSAIAGRIDAGESLEAVAQDYRLELYEVEAAILFEREAA